MLFSKSSFLVLSIQWKSVWSSVVLPLTWIASSKNTETFKIYSLCSAEERHTGLKQHEKVKKWQLIFWTPYHFKVASWLLGIAVVTTFSKKLQGRQKTVLSLFATPSPHHNLKNATNIVYRPRDGRTWEFFVHDEHCLVLNFLCPVLFFRWVPLNFLLPITAGQNVNQESLHTILWYHPAPLSTGVICTFIPSIWLCPNVRTFVISKTLSISNPKTGTILSQIWASVASLKSALF